MTTAIIVVLALLLVASGVFMVTAGLREQKRKKTDTYVVTIDGFDFDVRLTREGANGFADIVNQYEFMRGKGTLKIKGKF